MYRHFNKPYVLMLHAVLFSLFQYASTIVTYMIVLVQFDQSDKSHYACSRNVTNWVTWRVELVCVMWLRELHNLLSFSSLLLSVFLFVSSSSLSLPIRSPLLSKHQHALSGIHKEHPYMWQNRPVGANRQIWIFCPIVGRQWATW